MRKYREFSILLLFAAWAMPIHAQMGPGPDGGGPGGPGGPPGGKFPGGGRPPEPKPLKREKLDAPIARMFKTADVNADGLVTVDELNSLLVARRSALIQARMKKIDTDHDGQIGAQEFLNWQLSMGSVASSDYQPVLREQGPYNEAISPDLGDGLEDMMLEQVIEPIGAVTIVTANTNYDAGMSLDELLAYQRARFDAADMDRDGKLMPDELMTYTSKAGRKPGTRAVPGPCPMPDRDPPFPK